MRRRWFAGTVLAMALMLALTATVSAGGWAMVEMEKTVTRIEAGEETTIDFRLLQHGVTPTDWTTTFLEAKNRDTGETMRVDAVAGAETGDWSVTFSFPSAGTWDWEIQTEELAVIEEGTSSSFPSIEVVGSAASASNTSAVTTTQLDAAITSATDPLTKQISSMTGEMDVLQKQLASASGEVDVLQKQITNLTVERDMLQKQIANLEAAQAEQSEASGTSWWVAALAGAVAALVVGSAGAFLAMRRGLIRSPEFATASA